MFLFRITDYKLSNVRSKCDERRKEILPKLCKSQKKPMRNYETRSRNSAIDLQLSNIAA